LVELLVVMSIISLLSSITFANLQSARARARDSLRISQLIQLKLAFEFIGNSDELFPEIGLSGRQVSAVGETSAGYTYDGVSCDVFETTWPDDAGMKSLISNSYMSALPLDPINDPTQGYCYIYTPNPDRTGACVWALLEDGRKVGIAVGTPDTVSFPDTGDYPRGFRCGSLPLDQLILGGVDVGGGGGGGGGSSSGS